MDGFKIREAKTDDCDAIMNLIKVKHIPYYVIYMLPRKRTPL